MYMSAITSLLREIQAQTAEMAQEVAELQKPFAGMIDLDAYDEQQACYEHDARHEMI
jgi:hypothetical protein